MGGRIYSFEDFEIDAERNILRRLIDGSPVALTNKAFQVLLQLVENRGEIVTKGQLMERVWSNSFVEEANLTQTVSLLRKALGEIPSEHRYIVTESGRGYRFVAPVNERNGNSVAADSLPGSKRSKGLFGAGSSRTVYLLCGISLLILAAFSVAYLINTSSASVADGSTPMTVKSIAVLPFKDLEPADENALLGTGMAEAVIAKLSHIKSIVVRQAGKPTRPSDPTPEAVSIGKQINVDAVLEGTVQKGAERIRVSVRLFRVSDGSLVWAESFDEREADIFALQDAISDRLARSLSLQLTTDELAKLGHRPTENIEAYHLYNKGRLFWNRRSSDDLRKSIGYYKEAIAKDPNYALAYAGIAESYVLLQKFSSSGETNVFVEARKAAEKALSLDPNLAEAHAALALYNEQYEWNWDEAEAGFKKAIASNPNYATAHQWYAEFLAFRGRTDESIAASNTAFELDPLSLSTNTARAFPYLAERRYRDVIEVLRPALELDADFPQAQYYLARSYEGLGRYDDAIIAYEKAISSSGGNSFLSSAMLHSLVKKGDNVRAERTFNQMTQTEITAPLSKYALARGLAALGRREKALAALDEAFVSRDPLLVVMRIDPNFDEIREDPRFQAILKGVGF